MKNKQLYTVFLFFILSVVYTSAQSSLKTPETSRWFTPWTDPESNITSYVLNNQSAPIQQSFYFTNISLTHNGRFYWFYGSFPPSEKRALGVIDFLTDEIYFYPETQFTDASPTVDLHSGEVYWMSRYELYKRGPLPQDSVILVNKLPFKNGTFSVRTATHLTFNADHTAVNIDANIGNEWLVGELPLDGSPFILWKKNNVCYNHGQFSPVDQNIQLVAQDWWIDPLTGETHPYKNRMWIFCKDGTTYPLYPNHDKRITSHAHEWWSADGKRVYYVDYGQGTEYCDLSTGEKINVWENGTCHSHCDRIGRYFVGDIGTYSWKTSGCRVTFYDSTTKREINIVSRLPYIMDRGRYHTDPHPQFTTNDRYIIYTTTVSGKCTVAFVPVENLETTP